MLWAFWKKKFNKMYIFFDFFVFINKGGRHFCLFFFLSQNTSTVQKTDQKKGPRDGFKQIKKLSYT